MGARRLNLSGGEPLLREDLYQIVDFAKKLVVKTIAEYVHSSVILNKVKSLGIDYSQGFFIDEPTLQL